MINVYSRRSNAELAVALNNAAVAALYSKLRRLEGEELHAFLRSPEAIEMEARITGEEWYEPRRYYFSGNNHSATINKNNQDQNQAQGDDQSE